MAVDFEVNFQNYFSMGIFHGPLSQLNEIIIDLNSEKQKNAKQKKKRKAKEKKKTSERWNPGAISV
jgi:hypothetical protein